MSNSALLLLLVVIVAIGMMLTRREERRKREQREKEQETTNREALPTLGVVEECCSECKYWEKEYWTPADDACECKRFPPILNPAGEWIWPQTTADGWCGEFRYQHAD